MKIAILGYGVVGSGAYEILKKSGYDVKRVLDIRPHKELGDALTANYDDILNDNEIGVVAEAIGGLEPAHTFVVKALKAGKHVVSSNKHLICEYYDELHALAKENGVTVNFTSAVGGGIPWLYNLNRTTNGDTINKIMGIMNGTTNFILDAMISCGRDFGEVLAEAQALGYAEANPSADIDGLDVARKTAISSSIAFKTTVQEKDVDIFSLRNITKNDIDYIKNKFGKTVRYMGFGIKNDDSTISTFVEPVILPTTSLEANVNKNFNIITLFGESVGRLSFYGQGAGKYPTGHALASDVVDIVNGERHTHTYGKVFDVNNDNCERKYYIRASVLPSEYASYEKVGSSYYIITNKMKVSEIHLLAKSILESDPLAFLAGFEE